MGDNNGMCLTSTTNAEAFERRDLATTGLLKIRSYDSADEAACREMFSNGMQQIINSAAHIVLPKYSQYAAMLGVFAILAGMKWSVWILVLYILASLMVLAIVYIVIYLKCWNFINYCLTTDLWRIEKSYMVSEGSHMFVAEWKGEVVGMVGLIQHKTDKTGVAELRRMSVSSKCRRMGVAVKLIDRAVKFAKEQSYNKMVLSTSSAQHPAIKLYTKYGFKHTDTNPFPLNLLKGLEMWTFELQLY